MIEPLQEPEWRTRLLAVVGLVLLVTAAALAIAVVVYQIGDEVIHTVHWFMARY